MAGENDFLIVMTLLIMALVIFIAWMAGTSKGNLGRMEIVAAVHTAKTDVGWTYERYRIEYLRMTWASMKVDAKREYIRAWGQPRWTLPSRGPVHDYLETAPTG
ncbi:unnamed protein product [marine sediment metagenome]|uniref:Uncharacterized protein n=1 Tax=marine sediment metagenome TaxID=412755 RepID=X0ZLI1_9ZZZZ